MEIYKKESLEQTYQALHEAYSEGVNLEFGSKNGAFNYRHAKQILGASRKWCLDNQINFTPALLINGQEFPKEYERSDIGYFIEDLIETNQAQFNEENQELMALMNNPS